MIRLLVSTLLLTSLNAYAAVHQLAVLTPTNTKYNRVGRTYTIAISADGNTVAVGDPGAANHSNSAAGAVYIFVKPAGGWVDMTQTATLTPSAAYFDLALGNSISISGNTIVAGAYSPHRGNMGAAYVFEKPIGGWKDGHETAKLTPSDGIERDYFGQTVSISGKTIVVGAPGIDNTQGAAYVFVEPQGGWTNMTETTKLVASDGEPGDFLGFVAINGNLIVASAPHYYHQAKPGAGYVFSGSGSIWNQIAELTPSDWVSGDSFGVSLVSSGNTVVLNERMQNSPYLSAAYVFVEPQGGWVSMTETAELTASLPVGEIFSAGAISPNGNTILASTATLNRSGIVYAFDRPKTGWITTSTPNFEMNIEDEPESVQIGSPDIAAVSEVNTQAAIVVLYQQ
jgi:hypothetical protein